MTGVQRQAADLLQQLKGMTFSLAKRKGMYLDIGKMEVMQMALEKQVPEKPETCVEGYYPDGDAVRAYICHRCGYNLPGIVFKYCPKCGQAIDWSSK